MIYYRGTRYFWHENRREAERKLLRISALVSMGQTVLE